MKYMYIVAAFLVGLIPVNASELNSDAVEAVRFDTGAMAQQLTNETGCVYYLSNNGDLGDFKFTSNKTDRIVWVFYPPKLEYEADGLELKKVRFDNLGQDNSVFHLLVEEHLYKLHLSEETACLRTESTTPEAHKALVKAWVATFKGQPISNSLVVHTEVTRTE